MRRSAAPRWHSPRPRLYPVICSFHEQLAGQLVMVWKAVPDDDPRPRTRQY
jgi:hypothetical protein